MADITEITTATTQPAPALQAPAPAMNPFMRAQSEHVVAGAVEIESARAIAEAQAKLVIAQKFPRDPVKAAEAVRVACQRPGLAAEAFYSFPRGGTVVTGPSIRLAEELIRCWGNCGYGLRELSQRDGYSEMEAWACDYETNTESRQGFTVRHVRDTKGGGQALHDQRDIYEIAANMGARRMRERMFAILPADLVNFAMAECKRTLAGKGAEPLADRIRKMVAAFGALGISPERVEARLGHALQATTPEEIVELLGLYSALKDSQIKASDAFPAPMATAPAPAPAARQAAPVVNPAPATVASPPGASSAPATATPPPAAASTPAPAATDAAPPAKRGPGRPKKTPAPEAAPAPAPAPVATPPAPVPAPAPVATPPAPAAVVSSQPAAHKIDPVEVLPGESDADALARQPAAAYVQPAASPADLDDQDLFE